LVHAVENFNIIKLQPKIIMQVFKVPGTTYKNKKLTPVADTVFINLVLASECFFYVHQ
jgi:hypothetical protein